MKNYKKIQKEKDLEFFFKKMDRGINSLIHSPSIEGRYAAFPVVRDSVRQIKRLLGSYTETALRKFFCEGVVRIGGYMIYNDSCRNTHSKKKFIVAHENWARW